MHPYSTDAEREKFWVPLAIGILAFVAALGAVPLTHFLLPGLASEDARLIMNFIGLIEGPTVLVFYAVFHWCFEHRLWRYLSALTDLSGTWVGAVDSRYLETHTGHKKAHAVLRIRQSWSHILITLATERSISKSVMASLEVNRQIEPVLRCEYHAEPKIDAPEGMLPHHGVAEYRLVSDPQTGEFEMDGHYYTGRFGEGHVGSLKFRRVSRNPRAGVNKVGAPASESGAKAG